MKHTNQNIRKAVSRTLAATAALLLLASCHEIETTLPVKDTVVTVDALSRHMTKGYVEGTALVDTPFDALHDGTVEGDRAPRTIRLTAWLQPQSGAEQEYFRDEVYSRESDGLWHHDPKMYWPMEGHLDFLGYSSTIPFESVTWNGGKSTDGMKIYVDDRYTQDDVLFAFLRNQTSRNDDGHVSLVFDHAQAWVEFRLRATAENLVRVQEVILTDIYTAGDLVVEHPFATAEASWDFRREIRRDTPVDDTWNIFGAYLPVETVYLDMLIPEQPMKKIVIRYGLGESAAIFSHEFELTSGATWLMGKKYIYDITIAPTEITIAPSVVDWDAVVVDQAQDEIRITGTTVDSVSESFGLGASSRYWWRPDDSSDYVLLPYGGGSAGSVADLTSGDDTVTVTKDGSAYIVTVTSADQRRDYFTMTATAAGEMTFSGTNAVEYSLNGGDWTAYSAAIAVSAGDAVRWRGTNAAYHAQVFDCTGAWTASGNLLSLIDAEGFESVTTVGANGLRGLFRASTTLTDASGLKIPAKTLAGNALQVMFYGCTALEHAPASLPATSIGVDTYRGMFYGCSSLVDAPAIAASAIPATACRMMFQNCTALTAAAKMNVSSVADSGMYQMYGGCTALEDVSGLTMDAALGNTACYEMFRGCTAMTETPVLRVTTVGTGACQSMFYGCTALTDASNARFEAAAQAKDCFRSTFNRCAALVYPPYIGTVTAEDSSMKDMFCNCASLAYAPEVTVTAVGVNCCQEMFYGCAAMSSASKVSLPATILAADCYRSMFNRCASLRNVPALPAPVLAERCYMHVFYKCVKLNTVHVAAVDASAQDCMGSWMEEVSPTGTFYRNAAAEWPLTRIPEGWTVETE